jgi:preprotein translocase subunit SecG
MGTLLLIIHVIVCLILIFVVLIQSGKGAELGAAFGGSSQTLFGSRGVATFLSKLTTSVAVIFMLTSLFLGVFGVKQRSVVKAPKEVTSPVTKSLPDQGQPMNNQAVPSSHGDMTSQVPQAGQVPTVDQSPTKNQVPTLPPVQEAIPQLPSKK